MTPVLGVVMSIDIYTPGIAKRRSKKTKTTRRISSMGLEGEKAQARRFICVSGLKLGVNRLP